MEASGPAVRARARARNASLLVVALAAFLASCSDPPPPKPETDGERRARLEQRLFDTGNKDPWAFYELGELDERQGDLAAAVSDYGGAVALLPPFRATRPALALGRVHLKLGHFAPARRMLEEVVTTVAAEPRYYRENPDYREAALGLKQVYEHEKDERAASRLRARFLEELGGSAADWPEPGEPR